MDGAVPAADADVRPTVIIALSILLHQMNQTEKNQHLRPSWIKYKV